MGSSRSRRSRQRSKICDSGFNELSSYNDGALSKAIWGSPLDAHTSMWPSLVIKPEDVIFLKKRIEHLEKTIENLKKELEEKIEEKNENLRKELEEKYEEKNENLRKELKENYKNLQSQLADVDSKLMFRELLKNFKNGCYDIDKRLMNKACIWFPKEFPANSLVLLDDLKRSFGAKSHCIQKFWDLLTLAYKEFREVSWENLGKLMDLAYKNFPKEFSWENFKELIETKVPRKSYLGAEFRILSEKVSDEKLYKLMNLGRHVFHYEFPHKKFEDVMKRVHRWFPKEFPQEFFADTYTAMVAILVNRHASLEDEKLLDINNRKLDCLREVATKFQWSCENQHWKAVDFGKQFFLLCNDVALSNTHIFHPEPKGPRRMEVVEKARKGFFKIDGVDVGPVAMELAHIERQRAY